MGEPDTTPEASVDRATAPGAGEETKPSVGASNTLSPARMLEQTRSMFIGGLIMADQVAVLLEVPPAIGLQIASGWAKQAGTCPTCGSRYWDDDA